MPITENPITRETPRITENPIRRPDPEYSYPLAAMPEVTGLSEDSLRKRRQNGKDMPKVIKGPGGRLGSWGDDIREWQDSDFGSADEWTRC